MLLLPKQPRSRRLGQGQAGQRAAAVQERLTFSPTFSAGCPLPAVSTRAVPLRGSSASSAAGPCLLWSHGGSEAHLCP